MAEGFRSFAELLAVKEVDVEEDAAQDGAVAPLADGAANSCECTAKAMREAKLFRARVAEAVESAAADLLSDIAADVLARELQLMPADLRAIVDRALDRFAADESLRVRIAHDEPASELAIPIVRDASLLPGDAILEFRSGTVDARLGTRLARVLASVQ